MRAKSFAVMSCYMLTELLAGRLVGKAGMFREPVSLFEIGP
jgi:hypothetical protein